MKNIREERVFAQRNPGEFFVLRVFEVLRLQKCLTAFLQVPHRTDRSEKYLTKTLKVPHQSAQKCVTDTYESTATKF